MYILFFLLIYFIRVYFKYNNNTYLIFGIIVCALYFIPLFYIIFFNCKNNEIIRIDCIYLKDFENMFIGLVKMNEKSYKNTFLLKMSDIKEFVTENKDIDSNILVLKVIIFTNGSIQDICLINNRTIKELNGLIVHLNKRLNKDNNSMQNESLYPITPYENI